MHPAHWESINPFAANCVITSTSEQLLGQRQAKANTAQRPEDKEHVRGSGACSWVSRSPFSHHSSPVGLWKEGGSAGQT